MIYTRIYAPASEQTLATDEELKEKYGKDWEKVIKAFKIEKMDSEHWFSQLYK